MTSAADQPGPDPRRVRPYAMTGGRTRPTHDDLEIETLVSTTSVGEQTPKLTVEQRAIAALCHEILSIAEVSARLHLPLGIIRIPVGEEVRLVLVQQPDPRTHLALFQRYRWGTSSRARPPCSASSSWPS